MINTFKNYFKYQKLKYNDNFLDYSISDLLYYIVNQIGCITKYCFD